MIKGAPVKTEARAIPGASATTEVQNNILLAAPDPADASVVLLCRSSCMILLPLELCLIDLFMLHDLSQFEFSGFPSHNW